MTYEEAQAVSQIVSMAIFIAVFIAAVAYAFRSSNKKTFDHVAKAAIDLSDKNEKR